MKEEFFKKMNTFKKMRELKIFRNMFEIDRTESKKIVIHQDDMSFYNSWLLTNYHYIDKIIYRGDTKNLPEKYRPFLEKIGNPISVLVTESSQDTY